MTYKRILVPVDGSSTSIKGVQEATKLAGAKGSRLRLLHVVDPHISFNTPEGGVNFDLVLDALRRSGKHALAKAEEHVRRAGARSEAVLVENFGGRVADAIVEQAKRWRADLIVMGTHGRRGVNRLLLGSDAELVVRYSPVPVLLVPARGRAVARRRARR